VITFASGTCFGLEGNILVGRKEKAFSIVKSCIYWTPFNGFSLIRENIKINLEK
jgi:hypothetical protein